MKSRIHHVECTSSFRLLPITGNGKDDYPFKLHLDRFVGEVLPNPHASQKLTSSP